jgi:hypothetical protein
VVVVVAVVLAVVEVVDGATVHPATASKANGETRFWQFANMAAILIPEPYGVRCSTGPEVFIGSQRSRYATRLVLLKCLEAGTRKAHYRSGKKGLLFDRECRSRRELGCQIEPRGNVPQVLIASP